MPRDAQHPLASQRLRAALPGWLGGVLTGLQGAALSFVAVLAPALAAVAGAPSLDGSATVDWAGALSVATQVWLLGHGVPVVTGSLEVSLIPWGIALLSAAILVAVARRFASKTWTSWALACGTYGAAVAAMTALSGAVGSGSGSGAAGGTTGSGAAIVINAALLATLVAAPAVAVGIWRAYGARLSLLDRIPAWGRSGLRLGLGTLAGMVAVAALAGTAFAFLGGQDIAAIATSLDMDPLGAGALALGELLYVPTLVGWMVSWLVGPGFSVGIGSLYAPDVVTAVPVPHLPILGALPSVAGGWWAWAPVLVVVVAAGVRAALSRRIGADASSAKSAAVALGVVVGGLVTVVLATRGSVGGGDLSFAGAQVLPVVVLGTLLVVAGYGLVWGAVLAYPWVRPKFSSSST